MAEMEVTVVVKRLRWLQELETFKRKTIKVQAVIGSQRQETSSGVWGKGINSKELFWPTDGSGQLLWRLPLDQWKTLRATQPKIKLFVYANSPRRPSTADSLLLGWVLCDLRSTEETEEAWLPIQQASYGGELLLSVRAKRTTALAPGSTESPDTKKETVREEEPAAGVGPSFLPLGSRQGNHIYILSLTLESLSDVSKIVSSFFSHSLSRKSSSAEPLLQGRHSFWLSYSLFDVVVQTDIFRNPRHPRFSPLCDSFRLRSCLSDLLDFFHTELPCLSIYLCTIDNVLGEVKVPLSKLLDWSTYAGKVDEDFTGQELAGEYEFEGFSDCKVKLSVQLVREGKAPDVLRERKEVVEEGRMDLLQQTDFSAIEDVSQQHSASVSAVDTIRQFLSAQTESTVEQGEDEVRGLFFPSPPRQPSVISDLDVEKQQTGISTESSSDESLLATDLHHFRLSIDIRAIKGLTDEADVFFLYCVPWLGQDGIVRTEAVRTVPKLELLLTKSFKEFDFALSPLHLRAALEEPIDVKVSQEVGRELESKEGTQELGSSTGIVSKELGLVKLELGRLLLTKNLYRIQLGQNVKAFPSSRAAQRYLSSQKEIQTHSTQALTTQVRSTDSYLTISSQGEAKGELRVVALLEDFGTIGPGTNLLRPRLDLTMKKPATANTFGEEDSKIIGETESGHGVLEGLGPGGAQRHDRIAEMSSEDQSKPQSVGNEEASHQRELEPAAENAVEERKAAEYVGRQEDMKTKSSAPPASSPPLSNHLALEERLKAKAAEVSKLKGDIEELKVQHSLEVHLTALREQAKVQAEVSKLKKEFEAEVRKRAEERAKEIINDRRAELLEEQEAWNEWKRQDEARREAELKKKESERLMEIQEDWDRREQERKTIIEASQAEYARLEGRLRKSLADVEARERKLKEAEDDARRELSEKNAELQSLQRRLRSESSHAVALAKKDTEMMERRAQMAEETIKLRDARIKTLEEEFARYRDLQRRTPEAELQSELLKLSVKLQDMEEKLQKEREEKQAALDGKKSLRTQLERLAKALKRERQKSQQKVQEELEQLRLQYLAREERFVLDGDREELRSIRKQLDDLRQFGQCPQSYDKFERPKEPQRASSEAVDWAVHQHLPSIFPSPPRKSPLATNEGKDEEKEEKEPLSLADLEVLRLEEERRTLLDSGAYQPDHPIIKELERLLHIAKATRARLYGEP